MLVASGAGAQEVTIGYQGLPYKSSGESNTGIQVSDGVLLHVGAGAEAGYDTNVFYQDTNPVGSAIIRASLFGDLLNATRTGPAGKLMFDARAGIMYRRYTSSDSSLDGYKDAWMPTAGLSLSAGSGQVGFGLADTYARIEEPPYNPGQPAIIRDNNQASIEGRWAPGGGRLATMLRYTNMVDVFENNNYSYSNSDTNILMLDASWKWLPKTAIFVNFQQGYIFYLNTAAAEANQKFSSYPFQAIAGLRGLLTDRTSAVLSLGYANGFYSTGISTAGFLGSTYAELALTFRPTAVSRIVAGYRHSFENAIISAFSYNETAYLSYVQQIAGRVALDLSGRYVYKDYQGYFVNGMLTPRNDNLFQVGASLDYFLRNWVYAGVGYSLLANTSSLQPQVGVPALNYVKQQMFVRLGVTY
jgi:hypothetical protein